MKKFLRISGVIIISITLLVIALPRILNSMGLNPVYIGQSVELINKRALIITTSHSVLSKADEIKGKKTGVWVGYYYNGQLEYKGSFKNGKKDGIWEFYSSNGMKYNEFSGIYKNGNKISKAL